MSIDDRAGPEVPPTPGDDHAEACVAARNVGKRFGSVVAIENATFTIPNRHFTAVLGPSGCGKSTLLRLIAGLVPHEGELDVKGQPVSGPRPDVGLMFQHPTLLPWRSALENVLLPTVIRGRVTDRDREQAMQYLSLVGLEGFEFSYPRQLSGGMQQRTSLARLLMTGAQVLLLDEPFGALDEFTRERLNLELVRIHEEIEATTLFVTHNITEAVFLADEILVMTPRPGRLAGVVQVPFERPRGIELQRTTAFTDIVFDVREMLGAAL
ncbi:MAG: ABC transporter ATP-binding protein [Acidimicrobiia bacterium]|nr:ABC transporter ATP-binding protein [Acidimicrobiia bacterium]